MERTEGHRFALEPYHGPATRYTCPSCGHRRRFTRYVDTVTGEHLAEHVGKCDRQDKCGHHVPPREHFAAGGERPSGEWTPLPPPPEPHGYRMSRADVSATMSSSGANHLLAYLSTMVEADVVKRTAWEYCLGTWTAPGKLHGAAAFWQVDRSGEVRTAKLVQYSPANGHRVKGAPHWTHSLSGGIPDGFRLDQCLYGEHLLDKYPDAPVGIVEAEKTAVVARIFIPEVLWLAAGGKEGLTLRKALPLAGRHVTLWPDLGKGFTNWSAKVEELAPLFASLVVVDLLECIATPEEMKQGLDLADYLLSHGPTAAVDQRKAPPPLIAADVLAFIRRIGWEHKAEMLGMDLSQARLIPDLTNTRAHGTP